VREKMNQPNGDLVIVSIRTNPGEGVSQQEAEKHFYDLTMRLIDNWQRELLELRTFFITQPDGVQVLQKTLYFIVPSVESFNRSLDLYLADVTGVVVVGDENDKG